MVHCCGRDCFSGGAGQFLFVGDLAGFELNTSILFNCAHSQMFWGHTTEEQAGAVAMWSKFSKEMRVIDINFTSCKVAGPGAAIWLINGSVTKDVSFLHISGCLGGSMVYSGLRCEYEMKMVNWYNNTVTGQALLMTYFARLIVFKCIFQDNHNTSLVDCLYFWKLSSVTSYMVTDSVFSTRPNTRNYRGTVSIGTTSCWAIFSDDIALCAHLDRPGWNWHCAVSLAFVPSSSFASLTLPESGFFTPSRTFTGSSHFGMTDPKWVLTSHSLVASQTLITSLILGWSSSCGISLVYDETRSFESSQRTLKGSSHFENTGPRGHLASHTLFASPMLIESSIHRWSSKCGISSVYAGTEYFMSGHLKRWGNPDKTETILPASAASAALSLRSIVGIGLGGLVLLAVIVLIIYFKRKGGLSANGQRSGSSWRSVTPPSDGTEYDLSALYKVTEWEDAPQFTNIPEV
jgi:hypothetical protein